MLRLLLGVFPVLFAAAPASAQFDAWKTLKEKDLHTLTSASFSGKPSEIFAPCDGAGRLHLPRKYYEDYDITEANEAAFGSALQSAKRYADINAAFKAGYLVVEGGFRQSVGLMLAHPDLVKDGKYFLERPDVLTFVKKKGAPQFRLVGLLYFAGDKRPAPVANLKLKRKGKKIREGWGRKNQLCVMVKPKSIAIHEGVNIPNHCKQGTLYNPIYGTFAWPLVYNPAGIYAPTNKTVDYVDDTQIFGPLCAAKPGKPGKR